METDNAIRTFADFLNSSWTIVSKLLNNKDHTTNENAMNDWLQANWELLVEQNVLAINHYLEVYGDGADYNGSSSRIISPAALPDFRVIVTSRDNNEVGDMLNDQWILPEKLIFEKIVGFKNGFMYRNLHFIMFLVQMI